MYGGQTDTVLGPVHGRVWQCLSSLYFIKTVLVLGRFSNKAVREGGDFPLRKMHLHLKSSKMSPVNNFNEKQAQFSFFPFPTNMHLVQSKTSGAAGGGQINK